MMDGAVTQHKGVYELLLSLLDGACHLGSHLFVDLALGLLCSLIRLDHLAPQSAPRNVEIVRQMGAGAAYAMLVEGY